MNEQRKLAYRWLLYVAALDIRPLRYVGKGWRQRLNPFCWWSNSQFVREAGFIAEWLHNLAKYSAFDFRSFDEKKFWQSYQWVFDSQPGIRLRLQRYREEFDRRAEPLSESSTQS